MTAPVKTARITPTGTRLDDGYQTLVAFAADPDVKIWEKSITPPGLDGLDAIDITTMHNETYRTFAPRALITMTESSFTGAYDASSYNQIVALINVETTITIHFPDGSSIAFYGFLKNFQPNELVEGAQPEATCSFVPTNRDPITHAEEAPVYDAGTGT
jgi:hypothetical protein